MACLAKVEEVGLLVRQALVASQGQAVTQARAQHQVRAAKAERAVSALSADKVEPVVTQASQERLLRVDIRVKVVLQLGQAQAASQVKVVTLVRQAKVATVVKAHGAGHLGLVANLDPLAGAVAQVRLDKVASALPQV